MKRQSEVWFTNNPLPSKVLLTKSGFNTIIPLENGKTVTAKCYTEECLSNVLKLGGLSHKQWDI